MLKQCSKHLLVASARSNALSKSTYVRTYLRRTTHLGSYLTFVNARGGADEISSNRVENHA